MGSFREEPGASYASEADRDMLASAVAIEADYCAWVEQQVTFIRERRFDAVDWDNVAEELSGMNRSEFWRLRSACRVLLIHMLKWDQQPERRSRSWAGSIAEQRRRIARLLKDSPSLKARVPDILGDSYEDARSMAATETHLPDDDFPRDCPYSWDDIMNRPFDTDEQA